MLTVGTYFLYVRQMTIVLSSRLHKKMRQLIFFTFTYEKKVFYLFSGKQP